MAKKLSFISKEKLFPILVNRTVIFFFLMCLLTLFVYAVGTIQGFVDSTQLALLRLYTILGIFLTVMSICGVVIDLQRFFRKKMLRYLVRAGGYFILVISGFISVLLVFFIITLSRGNIEP